MNILVMGAGAWGTALAIHFAKHQHQVTLWTRDTLHANQMLHDRANQRYLPDQAFPDSLQVSADLVSALVSDTLVLVATPVSGLRSSLEKVHELNPQATVLLACKGFERGTGLLPHQVATQVLGGSACVGVLSGPSFAQELAQQLPCAVVLASDKGDWIKHLVDSLNTSVMRLYASTDVLGVALGGAIKNVMAIATGLCDGLNYGMNARAALMTRGLAEMTRLAVAMGAQQRTLMGLTGMGDLILTCTGSLSRNRQVGLGLAQGLGLSEVLQQLGHVAEGVLTIAEVNDAASRYQVDMPITQMLYRLLQGEVSLNQAVEGLMLRDATME